MKDSKKYLIQWHSISIYLFVLGMIFSCSHRDLRSPASENEVITIEDLTFFHSECRGDKNCLIEKIQPVHIIPVVKVFRSSDCSFADGGMGFTFRGDINGELASTTIAQCNSMNQSLDANKYLNKYGSTMGSAKLQGGECIELSRRVDLSELCKPEFSFLLEVEGKLIRNKK